MTGLIACGISGRLRRAEQFPREIYKDARCTCRQEYLAAPLLQVGFDYWRDATVGYGAGGNNHEAGASKWYLPSDDWQEAVFSDVSRSSTH